MRVSFLALIFVAILVPASWAIDGASLVFYLPFEEGNGDVTVDQISNIRRKSGHVLGEDQERTTITRRVLR